MNNLSPEEEAALTAIMGRIADFNSGKSRTCPTCGTAIETITLYEKIEPETYSLYTAPCGCRHGLWSNAPDWAHELGIVHVIPLSVQNATGDTDDDAGFDDALTPCPKCGSTLIEYDNDTAALRPCGCIDTQDIYCANCGESFGLAQYEPCDCGTLDDEL